MGNQDLASPEKTLVLYEHVPSSRFAVIVASVLFFGSIWCLGDLYDLPESVFPYRSAGYVEIADMEVVGNAIRPSHSGDYEFVPGGSSAWLYQRLLPTLLLVWVAFQLGRGCIIGQGRDLCFFFCLGCLCLICYSTGWVIQGTTVFHKAGRYTLFGMAGLSFLLTLGGALAFRCAQYSYDEPEALFAMARRMSKFGNQT